MSRNKQPLSSQIKEKIKNNTVKEEPEIEGNYAHPIDTGSTLLNLAISGDIIRGGGLPSGIFVEIFGPSSAGKTVLACEIAGAVQRGGGEARFDDPEARLNQQFARMFDFEIDPENYATPDRVSEVFENIRKWKPKNPDMINGTFVDSLAALSTDIEMDNDDGDKMGMRRAKEFSEGFRKNARILKNRNYLMVATNQVRENQDAGKYSPKFKSTGGFAIGFYASLRLRASNPEKIYKIIKFKGKEIKKVIGVQTEFEIFKSSIGSPYRKAPVVILFDYGIDDIRANLQFIKDHSRNTIYMCGDQKLSVSLEESIRMIENENLVDQLKNEVIDLWEEIDYNFKSKRIPKQR